MPLSKKIIHSEEAKERILPYEAKKFPLHVSAPAKSFISGQSKTSSSFRLDPLVAEQTGIAESERKAHEQELERKALEKLKEVQEEAYQRAYELGLQEGKEKAYDDYKEKFEVAFSSLEHLLMNIENLKVELVEQNERHFVRMIFLFASKIAKKEISDHPELIFSSLKECVARSQDEQNLRVLLAPTDLEFVKETAQRGGRDLQFLKRLELEPLETMSPGGCILESNYGQIDATLDTRVSKLWELLEKQLPTAKDKLEAS